jgi:hypothetical protein
VSLKGIEPRTPAYVSPKTAFSICLFVLRTITSKIYQQTARKKPKEAHKIEAEASYWMLGDSVKMEDWEKYSYSWFQTFAVFWILYAFFWVIPLRLNFICFLLGNSPASEFYMPTFRNTLFHLHRRIRLLKWNRQCSETSAHKIQTPGNYPEEGIQNTVTLYSGWMRCCKQFLIIYSATAWEFVEFNFGGRSEIECKRYLSHTARHGQILTAKKKFPFLWTQRSQKLNYEPLQH